jgi:hypothetical protein
VSGLTLEEFLKDLETFGFDEFINEREQIISSANRALRELYLSIPITKTITYHINAFKPITYYKKIVCKPGDIIVLPLVGKAFSMRVSGFGNYLVNDGTPMIGQYDSRNGITILSGFINGNATIKFWGSFTSIIYDLASFDDLFSTEKSGIPNGSPIQYHDIKSMYDDFISFASHPTDKYGKVLENCRVREGILEVDSNFSGEVLITYRRLPTSIYGVDTNNDSKEIIDVSREHEQLLVYLTLYYYWHGSDETKTRIYREKCDHILELLSTNSRYIDKQYVDVNRWA